MRCIGVACQHMRETTHPRTHFRLNALRHCPRQPLIGIGFLDSHGNQSVATVRLERITHAVCSQIARQENDGLLVQWDVTQPWICLLKHRVQHILDRLCAFRELVQHDDQRLAVVNLEPCVRIVAGCLGIVVNHRHRNVAQVHVRHVNVRMIEPKLVSNVFQQTRLADPRLPLQQEPQGWVGADKNTRLLQSHCLTEIDFSHF